MPLSSFADVEITEIMYDAEGSDSGFEWIEIRNTGTSNVQIADYHFYENDVHHGLYPEDFTNLGPGEYGVITQDITIFQSEYSNVSNLIKSSFSLNNTGEELAISDSDKNIIHSISYDAVFGAAGNGNSLHYTSSGWEEYTPSPGSGSQSGSSASNDDSTESTSNATSSSSASGSKSKKSASKEEDYYTAYIILPEKSIAGSPVQIEAYTTHTKGSKNMRRKGGIYYINFGDGTTLDSKERIDTEHIYNYPGTYTVVFEYYKNYLSKENNNEPFLYAEETIVVESHDFISINSIENDGAITLENTSSQKFDLKDWDLKVNSSEYTFPRYSYIQAGDSLTLGRETHKLSFNYNDWVVLRNEENYTISSFTQNTQKMNAARGVVLSINTNSKSKDSEQIAATEETNHLESYLREHPDKELVSFSDISEDTQSLPKQDKTLLLFLAGSAFVSGILIILRTLKRKQDSYGEYEENQTVLGEIELIE
ncbi:MAG: lamin tail domain-containing protein [Candidatus Pacebacteria bacterium]|nr:lamin tail domain-containing protein [Candidatus Paceibacterota bacterium]